MTKHQLEQFRLHGHTGKTSWVIVVTCNYSFLTLSLPIDLSVLFYVQKHYPEPCRMSCYAYNNDTIVQQPVQLNQLSSALLHDAKTFLHDTQEITDTGAIRRHPFFLYYSFPQVHTPMFHREGFKGKSRRGSWV